MPNHVTTRITIDSNHENVFEYIKSEDQLFDFNTIIPMPASLNIDSGTETTAAFLYELTNGFKDDYSAPFRHRKFFGSVFNPFSDWNDELNNSKRVFDNTSDPEGFKKLGKVAMDNYNKYGVATWYEWCSKNWGTKWNAYDIVIKDNTISFDTAWNSPKPILQALVERFKLTCDIRAFDEGYNFWFIQKYKDGELIEDRQSMLEDKDALAFELKGYEKESEEDE